MMKLRLLMVGFLASFGLAFMAAPAPVAAECGDGSDRSGFLFGIPTWDRNIDNCDDLDQESITATNEDQNVIFVVLTNIIAAVTQLAGYIAVIFVVSGGFKYVLSDGSPEKAADARKTILNALVGAGIAAMARVAVEVVHRSVI